MRLLTSALILLAFSSCSTYQYVTLGSPDVFQNAEKKFQWENDTVRVDYMYSGQGGSLSMFVYNKSDKPMYINWKKSAFIKNTYATSLYNSNVQVSGSFSASRGWVSTSGNMAGSFDLPDGMDFIPPGSHIFKSFSVIIQESPINTAGIKSKPQLQKIQDPTGPSYTTTSYVFDQAASPLQFKTYLTFVLGSTNAIEFAISHSFYVRELALAPKNPGSFDPYQHSSGDEFFLKVPSQ